MDSRFYPRSRRVLVFGTGSIAVGLLILSVTAGVAAAPPAGSGQALNVVVLNTPLPVTGTVDVTGDVGVTGEVDAVQSGTWSVGITGTPTVTSGDSTVLADEFIGTVPGGSAFFSAASANVTAYRSVRVVTNCFLGSACGNITVRVYSVSGGGRSYLLEQYAMGSFVADTDVYDVPGTHLEVQLINANAGPSDNIGVAIFGRAN